MKTSMLLIFVIALSACTDKDKPVPGLGRAELQALQSKVVKALDRDANRTPVTFNQEGVILHPDGESNLVELDKLRNILREKGAPLNENEEQAFKTLVKIGADCTQINCANGEKGWSPVWRCGGCP
jgi:hypothetical protein